jgi:hypothetical protein
MDLQEVHQNNTIRNNTLMVAQLIKMFPAIYTRRQWMFT